MAVDGRGPWERLSNKEFALSLGLEHSFWVEQRRVTAYASGILLVPGQLTTASFPSFTRQPEAVSVFFGLTEEVRVKLKIEVDLAGDLCLVTAQSVVERILGLY